MMPMRFLRNTMHPERYQGCHRSYPYFEGWYYKLIYAFEEHRYAVIDSRHQRNVRGSLCFSCINPWPVTLLSPGVMGWYAWVPFMECYHGVVSLDHTIEGILHVDVDGTAVDFGGGRGYTEKDWGRRPYLRKSGGNQI